MGEISINDAMDRIKSQKVKDRAEGLADLKHIFIQNRRSSKLDLLDDKSYHKLFESLFVIAQEEKSKFNKTTKIQKAQSRSKLSNCAGVLRIAVEAGVRTIRKKTVKALVDHITQTLSSSTDQYCEPIVDDYIKTLRAILDYPPHPEHFSHEEWQILADFSIEGLQFYTTSLTELSSGSYSFRNGSDTIRGRYSRSVTPSTLGSSLDQNRRSLGRDTTTGNDRTRLEDLVLCLHNLVSTTNAPVISRASSIVASIFAVLQLSTSVGGAHLPAFKTLNSVLACCITEDIMLAKDTLTDLVPLARRLWQSRSPIKEEMLIAMVYTQSLFETMLQEDGLEDRRSDLQGLFDAMQLEYCKRTQRDQMQADDIDLSDATATESRHMPLQLCGFRVRPGMPRSEQSWALLHVSALILSSLYDQGHPARDLHDLDDLQLSRKRTKLLTPFDGVLQLLESSSICENVYALQLIAFVIDVMQIEEEVMSKILTPVVSLISSDNSALANWSMLALSCAARKESSAPRKRKATWKQVWQLTSRMITLPATCHTACHLMAIVLNTGLVRFSEVANSVETFLTSVDFNGPIALGEPVVNLWIALIKERGRHSPGLIYDTSDKLLRWLFLRWKPSQLGDRSRIAHLSHHCQAPTILKLVSAILGLPGTDDIQLASLENGAVSHAALRYICNKRLISYLHMVSEKASGWTASSSLPTTDIKLPEIKLQSMSNVFADYLSSEIIALLNDGQLSDLSGSISLSTDVVCIVCSTCVVAFAFLHSSHLQDSLKLQSLRSAAVRLRKRLAAVIQRQANARSVADGLLFSLGPWIELSHIGSRGPNMLIRGASEMTLDFGQGFWQQLRNVSDEVMLNNDLMETEESFESQRSHGESDNVVKDLPRDWLSASTNFQSRRCSHMSKICLISTLGRSEEFSPNSNSPLTSDFTNYITSLTCNEFVACQPFWTELCKSEVYIDAGCGLTLLRYLGEQVLPSYELERCEVSLGLCLDIMTRLAEQWMTNDDDIAEAGSNLYEWFIKLGLQRKISSSHVYLRMSHLLLQIIKVRPDYGQTLELPSARTSLFQVLEQGSIAVKHDVGINISNIFGLFVLKEHDAILDDIIASLPMERDWNEGIALRLLVLAHLGSSWSTLLRRSIYAIFETPKQVPSSKDYARYCMDYIARALRLRDSKDLFKLFVSQIIFTWLHVETLRSLPYYVFEYNSLSDLLIDVQGEILGQLVMLGKDNEAEDMARLLSCPYRKLLEISFGKAAAYCIARDAAIPPSQDVHASNADLRLRKWVGKETYTTLISQHFPEILTGLFKSIDREDLVTKGFQKHGTYANAQKVYDEIIDYGASTMSLPVNQQPIFKASALCDEIQYLYSRSIYDIDAQWQPGLYVSIFRELLDSVHPALGSLHSCSVIRKLRVLVCIAGTTALYGYALEMGLNSLRPFLVDTNCAEDTIGIFKYLIIHGESYLHQTPSFLAGLAISTLASMRAFLSAPQESTTQESQFLRTMSKAMEFHNWLSSFTNNYTSPALSDEEESSFRSIVRCASQIREVGNARRGTAEGQLLLEILDDCYSGRNLIQEPAQALILKLLCSRFEKPPSFRDDIIGSDDQAAKYASVLWRICHTSVFCPEYLLWVGRVLGRAYSARGSVDADMVREMPQSDASLHVRTSAKLSSQSRSIILAKLRNILSTDNRTDVSLAERTLQVIVTEAEGNELLEECENSIPQSFLPALLWKPFKFTSAKAKDDVPLEIKDAANLTLGVPYTSWIKLLSVALTQAKSNEILLSELRRALEGIEGLPHQLFPYILHLVLLGESENSAEIRTIISDAFRNWFQEMDDEALPHIRLALEAILYLRSQPLPRETSKADRCRWLDINFTMAATAAARCRMFKTALLLLEIGCSENTRTKTSRRSSGLKIELPPDLLLDIYQNLNDKDSFYGVRQPSSLSTVMEQLEFEDASFKSLSFRGAYYDSQIRQVSLADRTTEEDLIRVLDTLDLNGLSQSVLYNMSDDGTFSGDVRYRTARKLERWDISSPPSHTSSASMIFRTFQDIHVAAKQDIVNEALNTGFSSTMNLLINDRTDGTLVRSILCSLAVLTEMEEVLSSQGLEQLLDVWNVQELRNKWMLTDSLEHSSTLLSCRETLFSTISKSKNLQDLLKVSNRNARAIECRVLLSSCILHRRHGALQSALSTATYLSQMIKPCKEAGLRVDAAVLFEGANVLWDQDELSASIRMLQDIRQGTDLRVQDIEIGKPELLAKLGHRISEARLEKPDEIIANYLVSAIKELHEVSQGPEAGQVFHEFAAFCDQQLQNADGLEDFIRVQTLRDRKEAEVCELDAMIKSAAAQGKEKDNLKSYRTKAKQWFELDNREFQRLKDSREAFLRQSLENYLLTLKACDDHDGDALRFSALWLEHSQNDIANDAVSKYMSQVASRKFASLMNQWTSRLLDETTQFQGLLSSLAYRICCEHPFHGMYQIFASSKTKGGKDQAALSRHAAACNVVNLLKSNKRAGPIWLAVHNSNINFVRFAAEKTDDGKYKPGSKISLRKSPTGMKLESDVSVHKVPPPTARLPLRADCDYSGVPLIAKFQPEFTVASGISAPKILTAIGTDGQKYKQLFKGGNDDLRQDAIMEQVFEQVSNLLRAHRATRQRNLGIRTYKVLPLTATSGIIEFVSNTIPLHDYLMPAHQRYFPNDLKPNVCRKHIADVQSKPVDVRVKTYRSVCDRFHPVLHYFFMERFENPDDWFQKRLAYTRSTAAISILGYILGLGDRHGHNILLDEKTGEVVHIDLGIAFEQGRVLPVPEVVPFRLTRDLVDGMGLTRTEGVFRRCCEFTLEALRNESYTIMTILDVLRYDPLYSWSLSPLRLKKLQDQQDEDEAGRAVPREEGDNGEGRTEKRPNEPGEADRALTVVGKKLGKGLSVEASVNELIQQATDERNLALLFCGWAAYA